MKFKNKLVLTISISLAFVLLLCQTIMAASSDNIANKLNNDSNRLFATVYGTPPTGKEVTGVSLDKKEIAIAVGKKVDLKATISPSNATNKTVTWFSSDQTVAKVNDKGSVTAVRGGSAKIYVITKDGEKSASCKVTVPATVSSVTLSKKTATIKVKKTLQLTASIQPEYATDKSVKWSSSNPSIASVDAKGLITAKKAGKATITVVTNSGKKVSTCVVTVTK